ncbi:beta-1,6-N-acetylglucosaminyltransferase [Sphingobacterium sp. SGR-19]|uniref:beta-1,6-N-acetylglucosaminyltransferase n=1 Tax=Sphingobacterium sp. SGR-19 TaxID=2710886 RepID=UPI0013EB2C78|nr:beta-1,6-N-acetylglucosaminyltransferase [Sphingobacterium sp. SGR-19]NGM64063.1 beta-1,6-N-acetylglucosaminyltransferase [Sphingobacterium sp. SGR-19]
MKHAYLIIAHNEFEVLQQLLHALDDPRNDIFIHFDAKVKTLPRLRTAQANLYIVTDRVDVRWGHVSQIEAEYELLMEAYRCNPRYAYFHIISGVHLPLYGQDYIHAFFQSQNGKQLIPAMTINNFQMDLKMNRYNLFMPYFASVNKSTSRFAQIGWRLAQSIQRFFHIRRYNRSDYQYGSNWVSMTDEAVRYLLSIRKQVLKRYKYTLCGDEFFVPTELSASGLGFTIAYSDRLLKHVIGNAHAKVYTMADYGELVASGCLFARKFSAMDGEIVNKMVEHSKRNG